jgi:K+-dependent Na+/Ca+ exchanger-like protein
VYMEVLLSVFILLFSFYALARVVDIFFIEALEFISKRLRLSSDIAGATFMAMGSSAPEFFISFLAIFRVTSQQAIGAGTIVGSAIFNILVIIGASALFRRATLTWQPVIRDLVFYIVTILILLFTFADGKITLAESLIYIGAYVLYLLSFKYWKKLFPYETKGDIDRELAEEEVAAQQEIRKAPLAIQNIFDKLLTKVFIDLSKRPNLYLFNFLLSILFLAVLSHLLVDSAVVIAHFFGVPEVIIGLTILAVGTSIPDLLSSVNVAKKGKGDMAIANAVGSNIFDIAIGLGLPWFVIIMLRKESVSVATENLNSSIFLLFATVVVVLFLLIVKRWEIGRYAGVLLIAAYVFYLLIQIGLVSFNICVNIGQGYCFGL